MYAVRQSTGDIRAGLSSLNTEDTLNKCSSGDLPARRSNSLGPRKVFAKFPVRRHSRRVDALPVKIAASPGAT